MLPDVTEERAGNDLAFLFDTRRVRPSGLAAEPVIPDEELDGKPIEEGALQRQFARTPYAVSITAGRQTFILCTLHVLYGDRASQLTGELRAIAQWMAEWPDHPRLPPALQEKPVPSLHCSSLAIPLGSVTTTQPGSTRARFLPWAVPAVETFNG